MNVKAAIRKIATLQLSNGGLSYWPGAEYTDDWATNYAGHFMIEASLKGYDLPGGFTKSLVKYQKKMANAWVPHTHYYNSDLIQAYRLYTLALANEPELGAMNRLKEQKDLSISAKWRLAAAYHLAGHKKTALKLTNNLSAHIAPYRELYYTYGSHVRDKAMILETLTLLNQKTKASQIVKDLSIQLSSDEWMSTQTTAYALMSLSRYYKSVGTSKDLNFTYKTGPLSGSYNAKTLISQVDMALKGKPLDDVLEVKNNGKGTLFGRIILEGIPAPGEEKASENNLYLDINYKQTDGSPASVDAILQGSDFIADVKVTNPGIRGEYKELALTMIVPPGWEIHNTRMDLGPSSLKMDAYNHMDIRDDRIYMYFNLSPNQSKRFQFMFNASYIGTYYLPAVYAEAMYDATINAKVPGKWVKVVAVP